MSLLSHANAGNSAIDYFVKNIGGNGDTAADAPCIKGTTLGTIRVGNNAAGVLIRGDTIANANRIAGGQQSGGSLMIGNSTNSFQNVVLTDGATTVNTPLTVSGGFGVITDGDVSVGGDLVLATGQSAGNSISGYWTAQVAVAASGAQVNPASLTQGVYLIVYVPNSGAYTQQPSGVFYWSGTQWNGSAVGLGFTNPAPDCSVGPSSGNPATLSIYGNGAVGSPAVPGTLYFRKLLN